MQTKDEKWLLPLNGLLNATFTRFFPTSMGDKIFVEVACEPFGTCALNGYTFKGFVLRWLALTAQLVPDLAGTIWPYIEASAKGAAGQCDGGTDGITCGAEWNTTTWDGTYGVGQQMSALAAIQANAIQASNLRAPYTADTGGTSKGDPSAGSTDSGNPSLPASVTSPITTSDKAGAAILTIIALVLTLGGAYFLVSA
jgi:mannan endo-1,6-alpha-mannosidase